MFAASVQRKESGLDAFARVARDGTQSGWATTEGTTAHDPATSFEGKERREHENLPRPVTACGRRRRCMSIRIVDRVSHSSQRLLRQDLAPKRRRPMEPERRSKGRSTAHRTRTLQEIKCRQFTLATKTERDRSDVTESFVPRRPCHNFRWTPSFSACRWYHGGLVNMPPSSAPFPATGASHHPVQEDWDMSPG